MKEETWQYDGPKVNEHVDGLPTYTWEEIEKMPTVIIDLEDDG